ncbi:MAG: PIN domain-containing protein [Candidatus Lokiarchaeota archaeon]|nr:PIN domain-containing protein [Candidatus Lokiarchaeota archaeon]
MKITIDTNVFLNVKNKDKPFYPFSKSIISAIDDQETKFYGIISIIVITELSVGYYINNEILEKNEFLSGLYSNKKYKIIEYTLKIADKAAEIRSKIKLKLPDCIILASALIQNSEILITNDSGFDKAKELVNIYTSEEFFKEFLKSPTNFH